MCAGLRSDIIDRIPARKSSPAEHTALPGFTPELIEILTSRDAIITRETRAGAYSMLDQNRYKMSYDDSGHLPEDWWHDDPRGSTGRTWQEAIINWLWMPSYKIWKETPSEDGRSGKMLIVSPHYFGHTGGWNAKATIID